MTLSAFHWREQRSETLAAIQPSPMARTPGPGRGKKRPVEQLTMEGEVIRQYPSLSEASRAVGQHESNISRAISGNRKTCAGYRWRFVAREDQILNDRPHGGAYSKA